ncbi:MAG: cation-translocating P-type ATPase [Clostridiales bacterium]|nr:cation-translocating P-type ATPase [Clostridiales bacterium]
MTVLKNQKIIGLTEEQVEKARDKYGKNQLTIEKDCSIFKKIVEVLKEPMFILLLITATIYFILGEPRDGIIMLIFVIFIIGIDVIQEWKTDKKLEALKDLSAPKIKVIRNDEEQIINSSDLVPGDVMIIIEGTKIPADGIILKANDLCIDESTLTGEAECIWKECLEKDNKEYWKKNYCYAGTLVKQGIGYIKVDKIGVNTEYGKIGFSIANANNHNSSPLQKQTGKLVKVCSYIAAILFLLVCIFTFIGTRDELLKDRIIESILAGVTLAMAMIPEEFPVVMTVFLSMGAWRLAQKKSLVRKLSSIETLGAISVLCVDKTGTITMNKMEVTEIWSLHGDKENTIKVMGMACEEEAYDPMEKAMLRFCEANNLSSKELFKGKLIKEYSFTNERKMMAHIWKENNFIMVTAKGSPEKIIELCKLDRNERNKIQNKVYKMSLKGLRVLAIAQQIIEKESSIPNEIEDCKLEFLGLVGLQDPPREHINMEINKCLKAGIKVVMITGDNGITARSIASKIGINNNDKIITGDMINSISDEELRELVNEVTVFSRVVPEHKVRIVKAYKYSGKVVAMTGDGVNDAPALKYADVGIAMGKSGSQVSAEAADLILLDDNFSTIVETIKDGRRIYENIKKAIAYIFTIHIPIAFSALLGSILGISSSNLFLLPIHVVLLELIIDPTCSIILERQPAEKDIMIGKARDPKENIISYKTLIKSSIQGIVLFIASFGTYYCCLINNLGADVSRSMGLCIIIISNLLLVHENSSMTECIYKNINLFFKDKVMFFILLATILGIVSILYTPLSSIFNLAPLNFIQISISFIIATISILWYEIVKIININKNK